MRNTIAIIAVPQRTKDGGISPMRLRTFSERSSILSWVLFEVSILVSKFKLVFYEIIICSFFLDERGVVSDFDNHTPVKYDYLVRVLDC